MTIPGFAGKYKAHVSFHRRFSLVYRKLGRLYQCINGNFLGVKYICYVESGLSFVM